MVHRESFCTPHTEHDMDKTWLHRESFCTPRTEHDTASEFLVRQKARLFADNLCAVNPERKLEIQKQPFPYPCVPRSGLALSLPF